MEEMGSVLAEGAGAVMGLGEALVSRPFVALLRYQLPLLLTYSFPCSSPTPSLVTPRGVALLAPHLPSPTTTYPHLPSPTLTYPHRPLVACVLSHEFR
jgi:hypothetical protein